MSALDSIEMITLIVLVDRELIALNNCKQKADEKLGGIIQTQIDELLTIKEKLGAA